MYIFKGEYNIVNMRNEIGIIGKMYDDVLMKKLKVNILFLHLVHGAIVSF